MALNAYIAAVRTLLHDPNAQFYSDATLTTFINGARQQIAAEGQCIVGLGSLALVSGTYVYANATVVVPTFPAGIRVLMVPSSISYNGMPLENRNWEWFKFYWLGLLAPASGSPLAWAPATQGTDGHFYIGPTPNASFNISIDGIWLPVSLVDDTTPEAIPELWTDAVQFYATYLAYLDSQRSKDAQDNYELYEVYMKRARGIITPLREEQTFPGGLAARTIPGQAPPTVANDR